MKLIFVNHPVILRSIFETLIWVGTIDLGNTALQRKIIELKNMQFP